MQLKKGQIIEFDVHSMAFGGRGIGKYEGITVFADRSMPGDRVRASLTKIKPKYLEAKFVDLVSGAKNRRIPRCKYSGVCGGCQFQFMSYEDQLAFKKQHVIDAFERIGKLYSPPVLDVIGCKDRFYYRNKMEFSFGYDSDMNFALGLHLPGRRYDILDIHECYLQSELSARIVNAVRDFMLSRGWLPFKYSRGEGFLRSLFIRETRNTGELMVNLATSDDFPPDFEEGISEFTRLLTSLSSNITSVYHSTIISRRGVPKRTKETLLYGNPSITEIMTLPTGDKLEFEILPQSFFQVNTTQAEFLYGEIMEFASDNARDMIFDLFCGTGTIGLFLAKRSKRVLGIELNEKTVEIARKNAIKNNIFNIDFFTGDVNKVLDSVKELPSLIVVDPPRAGLTEKIIKRINDFGAKRLIYVSCNPSTLARDCNSLCEYGFEIRKIRPVDMFPHTYHIENVCLLER